MDTPTTPPIDLGAIQARADHSAALPDVTDERRRERVVSAPEPTAEHVRLAREALPVNATPGQVNRIARALAAAEARGFERGKAENKPGLDFFRGVLHRFAELAVEAPTLSELLSTSAWLGMLGPVSERDAADALARAHARWDAKNPKDPLADAAGNRHHKDGSRCVDAGCQRARAVPRRHLEPR